MTNKYINYVSTILIAVKKHNHMYTQHAYAHTDGCPEDETVIPSQQPGGIDIQLQWTESDIGVRLTTECPCGNLITLEGGASLNASRYCGGDFAEGAQWEAPQDMACNFTETARRLCQVIDVSGKGEGEI